jgi:hypothetical protein
MAHNAMSKTDPTVVGHRSAHGAVPGLQVRGFNYLQEQSIPAPAARLSQSGRSR